MRALVIDMRDGGDWSMDLLFAGLVQNLGWANVDMFPYKTKHVEWDTSDSSKHDWGLERRSFGYTEQNRFISGQLSELQMKQSCVLGNYTHVFLDERMESFEQYLKLGLNLTDIKVIVVAGHDQFWNQSPDFVKSLYGKNFHMMFLDNWREEWSSLPYARLTNLSINWDHLWDQSKRQELLHDKIYDLCFMGYNSSPARDIIISHLEKRWGHLNNRIVFERRPGTTEAFVSHREFFEDMARSKICLNLAGAAYGGRAMRFYQIPYVGSFMLSQVFTAPQLDPFIDGTHCMYFDTLDELDQKIESMLKYDWIREMMAKKGHDHAMQHHTAKARVAYILDEVARG